MASASAKSHYDRIGLNEVGLYLALPWLSWDSTARVLAVWEHQDTGLMVAGTAAQHRGQDSAGMVTTAWRRFHEHRDNGLTSDVFKDQALMNRLKGADAAACRRGVWWWHAPMHADSSPAQN